MKYFETLARELQELYGLPDAAVRSWKQNGAIPSRYKELEVGGFEKAVDERLEYFLNHKAFNIQTVASKYPNTFARNRERGDWSREELQQMELTRKKLVDEIASFILKPNYQKLKQLLVENSRINAQNLLEVMNWTPKETRKFCDRLKKDAIIYQEEVDTCVAALGIFMNQIK